MKKILLFLFLSILSPDQLSFAQDSTTRPQGDFNPPPGRHVLRENINFLLTKGDQLLNYALTLEEEDQYNRLKDAFVEFNKAKAMIETCLDLTDIDGKFLAAKAYYYSGVAYSAAIHSFLPIENGLIIAIQSADLANRNLISACLLNSGNIEEAMDFLQENKKFLGNLFSDPSPLTVDLKIWAQFMIAEIEKVNGIMAECIEGTDSSHEGLRTRLTRIRGDWPKI